MATPPDWDRNATWGGSNGGAGGSRTPLRQAFSSLSKSSGKKTAQSLSASGSTTPAHPASRSQSPAPEQGDGKPTVASDAGLADDLDNKAKLSLSRQSSVSNKSGAGSAAGRDAGAATAPKGDGEEDTPLQRALKNPYHRPLPGHPGNLTTSQAEALLELTQLLLKDGALHDPEKEPPSYQETQLLFNVEAARTMYLKSEAWKKEFELDRLCEEFIFEEEEAVAACGWRMYFHKVDKLGRPIFIQDLSNLDTTKLLQTTTPERIIKKFAVTLELAVRHRYEACTLSSGRWVDDNMMVVNVEGLGLSTFWTMKDQLQQLLGVLDQNFPELSGRVQIIGAPFMFSAIWSLLKGWLPAATVEKVDIAGSGYLPLILKYVRKEDWPKHLGGECCCSGATATGSDGATPAKGKSDGCLHSDEGPWDKDLVVGASPRPS
ncbi:related to SEC14 -phosphatidylinositol/phosphatidylcholine transfer protein [Pseudozyma flocculosa]|uniref:Related to SEC14 -phosphatidylinositol/phosphatidylcholine transfer protein n=1 Tax=Pseudozyma flocculosa TaxID=84751 RepID=A0A5C3EZD5_9BASI|nr:related to SEC14 -phosphatidylinositol/phosphatidylcholine transfer protein [Pseudozyma flocculosa]